MTLKIFDPEVLVISGFVNKEGNFILRKAGILEEGDVRESHEGPFSIRTLDGAGNVLYDHKFSPSFEMHVSGSLERLPLEITPVVVTLPMLPGTTHFQVLKDDVVTFVQSATSASLLSAIRDLPKSSFKRPRLWRVNKWKLIRLAKGYQRSLERGHLRLSKVKLKLLRWTIEKSLREDYNQPGNLSLTKADILKILKREKDALGL